MHAGLTLAVSDRRAEPHSRMLGGEFQGEVSGYGSVLSLVSCPASSATLGCIGAKPSPAPPPACRAVTSSASRHEPANHARCAGDGQIWRTHSRAAGAGLYSSGRYTAAENLFLSCREWRGGLDYRPAR